MQLQQPQVNLRATSYSELVASLEATSLMVQPPLRLQQLLSSNRIKMNIVDTAYVPETS
jgi:hypothetical protein